MMEDKHTRGPTVGVKPHNACNTIGHTHTKPYGSSGGPVTDSTELSVISAIISLIVMEGLKINKEKVLEFSTKEGVQTDWIVHLGEGVS